MIRYLTAALLLCAGAGAASLTAQDYALAAGPSVLLSHLSDPRGYAPVLLVGHRARPLGRRRPTPWAWYLEPQLAFDRDEWEGGVNAGVRYQRRLVGVVSAYALAGLGPHYLSYDSRRQTAGFIFSDNVALGLVLGRGGVRLRLEARFRHLSNANLTKPNGGLNHVFGMVGITWGPGS